MKIALLHTSAVHVQTFDSLLAQMPDIALVHEVEEAWLQEAIAAGVGELLHDKVSQRLLYLAEDADLVVFTCSTLGPIADDLNRESITLRGGEYAVFEHRGPATDMSTVMYIFQEWLTNSKYELDDREHFEKLPEGYSPKDPEAREEFWIPVKPR